MTEENLNWNDDGSELASDFLAMKIDEAEGNLNIAGAISDLLRAIEDEHSVVITEEALLEKFDEIYLCNPTVYAENSEWAADETDSEAEILDKDIREDGVEPISLGDLHNL